MNNLPRFVSRQIGRVVSRQWLFKRQTPLFLPFYHVIANQELPHVLNYPYRSAEQFEKEIDFFTSYFKPVSLEQLPAAAKKNERIFHLSFDDGLKECAEIVAPLLKRKGIPATFFVNTAFIDNKQLFHKYKASLILNHLNRTTNQPAEKLLAENHLSGRNILKAEKQQEAVLDEVAGLFGIDFQKYLEQRQPYLTTSQLKALHADGFTIGAHSHDHPEFYKISEEQQVEQVKKSVQWVEENIPSKMKVFSFPFTDSGASSTVLKTIREENICDFTFGTAGVKYDEFDFHFQRYPVEQAGDFVSNLKAEFVYFELRKLVGKAVVKH